MDQRAGRPQEFILYYLYTGGSCLDGRVKNIYSVLTMRSMEEQSNEEECIRTLRLLSGDQSLEEFPIVIRLSIIWKNCPWPVFEFPETNGKKLIRNKSFYKGRLLGRYWRVVIEATGFKSEK